MSAFAFKSRARNFIAVITSILAVLAIAGYMTAPVSADPSVSVAYASSRHPQVSGVVKLPSGGNVRKVNVKLVFRNAKGDVIATLHPSVDRHGVWRAPVPRGALKVSVSIRDGGSVANLTEAIRPGRSMHVTAVFPGRNTGLLPGLFPY